MAIDDETKLLVDAVRQYVIFWATMFMTSTLGIVRLLSDFKDAQDRGAYFYGFSVLYLFFIFMNMACVDGEIRAYKILRELTVSGKLGNNIKQRAFDDPTPFDKFLSYPKNTIRKHMRLLSILPFIFYSFLYYLAYT